MTSTFTERTLRERIAEEEERLARLEAQRTEALARVRSLREQLDGLSGEGEVAPARPDGTSSAGELTSAEKLELFARRFRGRLDVFATRWTNRRTGRSGYAPACANEWVRGICEKPRIRCGECPHQAFLPMTERVLLDHLLGRCVAGVYPLLPDETCVFRLNPATESTRRRPVIPRQGGHGFRPKAATFSPLVGTVAALDRRGGRLGSESTERRCWGSDGWQSWSFPGPREVPRDASKETRYAEDP